MVTAPEHLSRRARLMWKDAIRLFAVLVGVEVALGGGASVVRAATKAAPEARQREDARLQEIRDILLKGGWENWEKWVKLLNDRREEGEVIAESLIKFADDEKRDGEMRILAITLLGKVKLRRVMSYLLENIGLHVDKMFFMGDADELKEEPCFFVLSTSVGWQAVPYAFEFLEGKRSDKQLEMLGRLFKDVCGRETAVAILDIRMKDLARSRGNERTVANIRQVVRQLSKDGENDRDK